MILLTSILLLVLLIGLNAFFAASEIALISLNDNKIKQMAEDGNKKAIKLHKILSEPSRFLATIQIGITLAGFLASAFAADTFAEPIVNYLKVLKIGVPDNVLRIGTVLIITIILSYFTLVLGELVPKRIAMKKSESIAFFVVPVLSIISAIANPFVKFLSLSTNVIVRLFGIDPDSDDEEVTEEEIRMMVDVGEEKGAIDPTEKQMINNIFEFNNKTIEDVMTHRIEMISLSNDMTLDEILDVVNESQYSRYPVYEDTVDNIVGILNSKDLIPLIDDRNLFSFDKLIRKPTYVPLQKKISDVFFELQNSNTHIAIVIDEYGGTAGLVTIEDLLEEIVGNIFDEYDHEDDLEIKQLNDRQYEVSGMVTLLELNKALDIEFPVDDHDTLNGMLINLIGTIPPKGEITEVRYKNLLFETLEVTHKRIIKVLITINEELVEE